MYFLTSLLLIHSLWVVFGYAKFHKPLNSVWVWVIVYGFRLTARFSKPIFLYSIDYIFSKNTQTKENIFRDLKKLGEYCRTWENLNRINLNGKVYRNLKQFASIFILDSDENSQNLNHRCLSSGNTKIQGLYTKKMKENEKDFSLMYHVCDKTTRVIYGYAKRKKGCSAIGVLDKNRKQINKNIHTEEELFCFLQNNFLDYEKVIHDYCGFNYEEKNEKEDGYQRRSSSTYHLYVYSHNSPCKNCLNIIGNFSRDYGNRLQIKKILIAFDKLYNNKESGTTLEDINKFDNVEFWMTQDQYNNIKS